MDVLKVKENLKRLNHEEIVKLLEVVFIMIIMPVLFGVILGIGAGWLIWG